MHQTTAIADPLTRRRRHFSKNERSQEAQSISPQRTARCSISSYARTILDGSTSEDVGGRDHRGCVRAAFPRRTAGQRAEAHMAEARRIAESLVSRYLAPTFYC